MDENTTSLPPVSPDELEQINKAQKAREELESLLDTGDMITILTLAATQID